MSAQQLRAGEYSRITLQSDAAVADILRDAEVFVAAHPAGRTYAPDKAIAYVPVDPALAFSGVYGTLGDEIECLSRMNGTSSAELIDKLELAHLTQYSPDDISCGQAVRAAIGVAAASNPGIWVFDRCFEWLEEESRQLVSQFVRNELRAGKPVIELSAGRVWLLSPIQQPAPKIPIPVSDPCRRDKVVLEAERLVVKRGDFQVGPFSLQLYEGEALALAGPNGVGKTTLALALAGLLEFEGAVRVSANGACQRRVLYAFQKPDDQLFRATVRDELTECARRVGDCAADRVQEIARVLKIEGRERADPFSLSLGARRLLTTASVLAASVPVAILDEPSAFLSAVEVGVLLQAIEVARAHGTAVIAITHDEEFARSFANRTVRVGTAQATA